MEKTLQIDVLINNKINYQVKLGDVKTLRMHFNKKNILIISAPFLIKKDSIISFVEKNIKWIIEKNNLLKEKEISYEENSKHLFLGKEYTLKINYSKTPRVDLIENIIIVSTNEKTTVKKQIIEYRKEKSIQF